MKPFTTFAFTTALLLAGCSALQPPRSASPALYLLDAQAVSAAQRPQLNLVIGVDLPRARPGFATAQIAYVREPPRLEYYASNRWVDAPARMLAPLLAQALAQSGTFRAVVPAASAAAVDLRLDTELMRLQHDYSTRPSRVQLGLRAQLIEAASGRVLGSRQFDADEIAPGDNAHGSAVAANRALARVLGELVGFCAASAAAR
jgi:cholesterol transport system auxiliary component